MSTEMMKTWWEINFMGKDLCLDVLFFQMRNSQSNVGDYIVGYRTSLVYCSMNLIGFLMIHVKFDIFFCFGFVPFLL